MKYLPFTISTILFSLIVVFLQWLAFVTAPIDLNTHLPLDQISWVDCIFSGNYILIKEIIGGGIALLITTFLLGRTKKAYSSKAIFMSVVSYLLITWGALFIFTKLYLIKLSEFISAHPQY